MCLYYQLAMCGAPIEFNERDSFEPISDMEAGGYFDLPAGAWTDTAMSLALFHSLKVNKGLDSIYPGVL